MNHAPAPRPTVALFRLQLFKPSETFITEQARSLVRHTPVFMGRELHGPAPEGARYRTPEGWQAWRKARFALTSRPDPFSGYLRECNARLVHAHFGPDALAVARIARHVDVPLITTLHGFDVSMPPARLLRSRKLSWVRYALGYRRLAKRGDLFICVSDEVRRRVVQQGFPGARVVRHYIGTDLAALAGPYPERERGAPLILHVARMVEKKGTEYLLRAFAGARSEAQLVIIGDGPLRARLEALAAALGVAGAVRFLGAQPHAVVREWMRRASLFALPSVTAANGDAEGLPISIIEAAGSALAVLATRHSGIPEAVEHERGGLLVAERSVPELQAALCTLLASAALRERMGAAAQQFARRKFDLCRQSAALEDLYARVT